MIGRSELCQGLAELVAASQRVMAIDHLDRLIERLCGKALGCRGEMEALPGASGGDGLRHVQSTGNEDQAEDWGGGRVDVSRGGEPDAIRALGTKVGQQLAGD